MRYKKYFRKSSIKKVAEGNLFLQEINRINPKTFLEIGIFQGVLAKNVCDLMFKNHGENFKYYGIDIFETDEIYKDEIAPSLKINNPLKKFYFKYIKKYNPYSIEAVQDLLNVYKNNIKLIKGNSNTALKDINLKNVDLIFIDGGHDYSTVKNDLNLSKKIISQNGTILCDDYNLTYAAGVKKAIDEFINENNCQYQIFLERFVKINL